MLDVYIWDCKLSVCEKIKNICEHYMISRNYDNEISYCGTESDALIDIAEKSLCGSIFMLEACGTLKTLSKQLRNLNVASYIVISINALSDLYEFMSPSVRPSGIIVKPPEGDRIERLLDEIEADLKENMGFSDPNYFVFKTKSREYYINLDNIIFFESREKKMFVRTKSREFSYYGTFGEIEKQVDENFVRVHKSFMINKRHISEIDKKNNVIIMDDETSVVYSRTYKDYVCI